ncbi:hypothetical protein N7532_011890 [Penicillium argentinense]|uniref:SPIN90/Ldb17 leucine-rich domain-containing protein n=1 Tax=Penicillium argentinense TaxID=1131581 RepID=A0A9W9JVP0_9EURO|nr:uncharacterized protein N7532_011890 [Penicillium argentinense]KAJ5082847.1 hypothetical protein N7532_011890 [Penicillium argentinense]
MQSHATDEHLRTDYDISRCSYRLFASSIFAAHADYVRRQIIYGLLQEDDPNTLHLIAAFLLFDGRQNEASLHMLNEEGAFARLLELIQALRKNEMGGGAGLHRLLMDLLYEMSRIQRVKIEDLVLVDDDFIRCLFDIIEDLSFDVTDPYHYPVIRVLLLTLKLLYLIFTTPSTYEYFFTNDLHVLVDILIRNLLDLPEEASALRHTYLRVLYPLLAHTQLQNPPHYKRDELRRVLSILVRGQVSYGDEAEQEKILHFEEVDETTRRLVGRCATVAWLRDVKQPDPAPAAEIASQEVTMTIDTVLDEPVQQSPVDIEPVDVTRSLSRNSTIASSPDTSSPTRMDSIDSRASSETPESRRRFSTAQRLGMQLEPATSSSLSVQAVASQHEKPGIITPSRKDGHAATDIVAEAPTLRPPKIKPEPPKTRRWRGRRLAADDDDQHSPGASSDHNTIPEGVEISPTSTHTAPTPSPTIPSPLSQTSTDRRNSASGSHLAPPVPGHARRSASNPPPAVPPPRRSTQTTPSSSHHRPTTPVAGVGKHGQAPPPPKTRRWARGKQHAQADSVESGTSNGSQPKETEAEAVAMSSLPPVQTEVKSTEGTVQSDPFSPKSPTSPTLLVSPAEADEKSYAKGEPGAPVSVEEAVQNVSLN